MPKKKPDELLKSKPVMQGAQQLKPLEEDSAAAPAQMPSTAPAMQQPMTEPSRTNGLPEANAGQLNAIQEDTMFDRQLEADAQRLDAIANQPEQQPGGAAMNGVSSMTTSFGQKRIGEQQVMDAESILLKYKKGKHNLEQRIVHDQQWWKLRNWQEIEKSGKARGSGDLKSNTAWLWNCVVGKHADFMSAFPEPIVLPRAEDDKEEAERLSEVVPVILEQNEFEQVYSEAQWQKLTEGTACYGVFWDKDKLNGLGDVAISKINMLNLFWEPGVTNIQDSRHVFLCELEDDDMLQQQYPELRGKVKNSQMTLAKYMYDDTVDTEDKSVVVDWYYHTYDGGKKILHYCKFVGHNIVYATENDPEYADRGLYDDGMYPFVLDAMYPVEGSPCGMGLIDIGRDAQTDIDVMNQAMVRNTAMSSTPRFFVRKDGSINEDEFADWSNPIVHVNGNLGQDTIQPVQVPSLANLTTSFLQQKVDELKFVTGNVDINNGSAPSGVTAASAIAALKEDAGRSSMDSSKSAYRAYRRLVTMVIERIRQFYDMPRQYRIVGQRGEESYQQYDNSMLQPQPQMNAFGEDMGMRLPVFDIMVRAQRENAYTKTAQNELAIQFYQLGFFNPQMADQTLMALDMMDFRGKEDVIKKVQEGQTLMNMVQQMTQLAMQIAQNNGDQAGMMAVQQVAIGGGAAPAMGPEVSASKGDIKEGDAINGLEQTQRVPAAKQMNRMAQRVNDAKVPN